MCHVWHSILYYKIHDLLLIGFRYIIYMYVKTYVLEILLKAFVKYFVIPSSMTINMYPGSSKTDVTSVHIYV